MKTVISTIGWCRSFFLAVAAAAAFSRCADTQVQNEESLLTAAGFGALTSATEPQSTVSSRLTPYELERNTINGKAVYIYADKQKGVAYVGGDEAYNITLQATSAPAVDGCKRA